MNILMITSNDPAGVVIGFTNAINRYTPHRCRMITTEKRYNMNYEKDIHLPDIRNDEFDEVEYLLRNADIIHFHLLMDENWPLGPFVIRDFARGKILINHHHGHPYFMVNQQAFRDKYKRLKRPVLVSTPDLLTTLPGSTWIPNPVPINDVLFLPRQSVGKPRTIRICQAPTRKYHKNTVDFLAITDAILAQFPNVERVVIEGKSYEECLRIKRECQIVFDHMQGHFGISSLESLSQGVPVIAGLDDWNVARIKQVTGAKDVPWVIARTRDALKRELLRLIKDDAAREETGRHSREWMEKYWREERIASLLVAYYERLGKMRGGIGRRKS